MWPCYVPLSQKESIISLSMNHRILDCTTLVREPNSTTVQLAAKEGGRKRRGEAQVIAMVSKPESRSHGEEETSLHRWLWGTYWPARVGPESLNSSTAVCFPQPVTVYFKILTTKKIVAPLIKTLQTILLNIVEYRCLKHFFPVSLSYYLLCVFGHLSLIHNTNIMAFFFSVITERISKSTTLWWYGW